MESQPSRLASGLEDSMVRSVPQKSLPSTISSILFVCMGNICRSPAGENVMRDLLKQSGLDERIRCDSAGTIGYHTGNPPDPRMTAAGQRRGLAMTGKARQVRRSDLQEFDLVLAMDEANLAELEALAGEDDEVRTRIHRFCDYCQRHDDLEVPDPYYGGEQGFEHVLDLLEDGCSEILRQVQAQEPAARS